MPKIISTIVDYYSSIIHDACGYKPKIISTIVEMAAVACRVQLGYKPKIISTIVNSPTLYGGLCRSEPKTFLLL